MSIALVYEPSYGGVFIRATSLSDVDSVRCVSITVDSPEVFFYVFATQRGTAWNICHCSLSFCLVASLTAIAAIANAEGDMLF